MLSNPLTLKVTEEINQIVQTIQLKFKNSLVYIEKSLDKAERIALYSVGNYFLVTSLSDG